MFDMSADRNGLDENRLGPGGVAVGNDLCPDEALFTYHAIDDLVPLEVCSNRPRLLIDTGLRKLHPMSLSILVGPRWHMLRREYSAG